MAAWIQNKYIVTSSSVGQLKPGDEIAAINDNPATTVLAGIPEVDLRGHPAWKRVRSTVEALQRPRGDTLVLTVRPYPDTATLEVAVTCDWNGSLAMDARPAKTITELEKGIWYVGMTWAQEKEFDAALPDLASAKGIAFDMRGHPDVGVAWFSHVTKRPCAARSGSYRGWTAGRDDLRTGRRMEPSTEGAVPRRNRFPHNGGAISYAESTMGIVENYKLGEILGETTAGTNGNVNPFTLPGGYNITWTGMKVLKQDGSRHHGVGIRPTIPVSRTQAGVAAGRDEILERGVAVLKQ